MRRLILYLFLTSKVLGINDFHNEFGSPDIVFPYSKNILTPDSLNPDSSKISTEISTSAVKSKVRYSATDSIRFNVAEEKVYLYTNAKIYYEAIELQADYIEINWQTHLVFARGKLDSVGQPVLDSAGIQVGLPFFKETDQTFKAHTIMYNFDTKKGKITYVTTHEGEGYIHGETVKKMATNNFFISHGIYTTCDLDTPHYYIGTRKLKVIQNKKIVTGPAYLVIEDVTTPFVIPFGLFPNKKGQASGILIPVYGESTNLGFFLKNGGYYFGLSDHFDLALRGDIYTFGSWALNTISSYSVKYHYNGNLHINYSRIKIGDPEIPSKYSLAKDFFIRWTHTQDPKARPNSLFSASVNAGSSTFYRNNLSAGSDFLTNTFQSAISFSKSWPGKPYSFSTNIRHSQNTLTKQIDITAPDINFSVARIYPLLSKNRIGDQKWYEKIGLNYTMNLQNNIRTYDTISLGAIKSSQFSNGIRHTLPISTAFKVLKYFTLTPSFNYTDRWYTQSIQKHFDSTDVLITDTIPGFKRVSEFGTAAALSTRIYGMYSFHKGKVVAIRHVMTPNLTLSTHPDFGRPMWKTYSYAKYNLKNDSLQYSYFGNSLFGGPAAGKSGLITFGLDNNLEMKVKTSTDTSEGFKKIKLLESLSFGSSYNLAADSLKLSTIGIGGRTTLFEKVGISFNGVVDPYAIDSSGKKYNKFEWDKNHKVGRLTSTGVSVSFNFNQDASKNKSSHATEEENKLIKEHPENYIDFNIPWTLAANYNLQYSKGGLVSTTTQSFSFNGDLRLTPKWKIGFMSGYDFVHHQVTYSSINIYRDLHCWEMHLNWIPFGQHQSYSFQINVKAPVLQDLKLIRKRDWYDNQL